MSPPLQSKVLEVWTATKEDFPFDEMENNEVQCESCGDECFVGDRVVWLPDGERRIIVAHDWCAVRNGYRLSWENT